MNDAQADRPLVTFAVFCYQQASIIEKAIHAALAQSYSPLEIIVSDDCSQDGTYERVRQLALQYDGPHRFRLNRNDRNLGIAGNVDRVSEIANGALIIAAAGDDVSHPNRAERLVDTWLATGRQAHAVHSACLQMPTVQREGRVARPMAPMRATPHPAEIARHYHYAIGATLAWTKELADTFGPISTFAEIEDHVIVFRASLMGQIAYIDEVLVDKEPGGVADLARPETGWDRTFGMHRRDLRWKRGDYRQFAADLQGFAHPDQTSIMNAIAETAQWYEFELSLADAPWYRRVLLLGRAASLTLRKRRGRYLRRAAVYAAAPVSIWLFDARRAFSAWRAGGTEVS